MRFRLPAYVHGFTDRHGKARFYFRKPGLKRATLPGLPYSPEFMVAYEAALAGETLRREVGTRRALPGTIAALTTAYFNSGAFTAMSASTRATYRGIIERFAEKHGSKRVALMRREHVVAIIARKAATPAAANNTLKMIRLLMRFAIELGLREDDPTVGIKPMKTKAGGFYTWTEADIAAYEAAHPIGSRARLALALLLHTAQRRSDVIRMGKQHIKGGTLTIRQQKTEMLVEIPVSTGLRAVLDATPNKHLTFLTTEKGEPFTAAGFTNWFRDMCGKAKLPKPCSPHGLRKAAARRMAEAGCTAHEIMSVTGHKTLREVTRYTEAADRKNLATVAAAKLEARTLGGKPG